jgi:hypothetical protein
VVGRMDCQELCLPSCPFVLDATQDAIYTMLSDFLSEMAEVFVDPVLMLGVTRWR